MKLSHKNTYQTVWWRKARHSITSIIIYWIWFDDGWIPCNYIKFIWYLLCFNCDSRKNQKNTWKMVQPHQNPYGSDSNGMTIYNCNISNEHIFLFASECLNLLLLQGDNQRLTVNCTASKNRKEFHVQLNERIFFWN